MKRTRQHYKYYISKRHSKKGCVCASRSLAGELGQPLLVRLNGLLLGLPLEVLLRRHQEERYLAALGARAADILLWAFALAPRAQALYARSEKTRMCEQERGGGRAGSGRGRERRAREKNNRQARDGGTAAVKSGQ